MKGLKENYRSCFRKGWPVLLLTLLVGVFFWKVLLREEIPLPGDFIVGVYYPWLDYKWGWVTGVPVKNPITSDVVSLIFPEQMLVVDLIKRGMWPLWNSYILGGTPLMANLQAAAFSPTNFLYLMFEKLTAWSIQIMLQHWLAGVGMYVLMRHWRVSKAGSTFSAVAYAFCGFNMIFSQWNGHTLSAAFIPWAVCYLDKYLKKGRYHEGVILCLVLAGQFMAGYPQTSLYTILTLGLYVTVDGWGRFRQKIGAYMGLTGFAFVTVGLTCVQWWPAGELWGLSQRGYEVIPKEWAFIPWEKLVTIVAADYFGNHATQNYWGPQNYLSNSLYVGVVCLVMALVGLKMIRGRREGWFLIILTVGVLGFCLPTPWAALIWKKGILGMQSAYQDRMAVVFNFGLAGLAGFGVERYLKEGKVNLGWALGVVGVISALLVWVLQIKINSVAARNLIWPLAVAIGVSGVLWAGRRRSSLRNIILVAVFGLMVAELYRFWWKYTPFSKRDYVFPKTPVIEYLMSQKGLFRVTGREALPDNLRIFYRIESLEGYETIHPLEISELVGVINNPGAAGPSVSRYVLVDNETHPALGMANVKYYLALKRNKLGEPDAEGEAPERLMDERFVKVFEDKTVLIFEDIKAMERAAMFYDWEVSKNKTETLRALGQKDFLFKKKIIIEEGVHLNKVAGREVKNMVRYLNYDELSSVLEVETAEEGLLFVSQEYYPGWKVWIDGKETKILRANHAFCAIKVPIGEHKVELRYQPESFKYGMGVTLGALGIMGMGLVGKRRGIKDIL